jgi:hypothetical protein
MSESRFSGLLKKILMAAGTEAFESLGTEEGLAGGAHGRFGLGEGLLIDVHLRNCLINLFITGISHSLYLYTVL